MCLTCAKHTGKGWSLHAPIRGGRNVMLNKTTTTTGVGCAVCGGKHSSTIHAGEMAVKHPTGFRNLTKGYPGSITGHVKGTGRKLRLGK